MWYQDILKTLLYLIYGYFNLLKYLITRLTTYPNDIIFTIALAISLFGVYKILQLFVGKNKNLLEQKR